MQKGFFYHFGRLIYAGRFVIVLLTTILVVVCFPFIPKAISNFNNMGFLDPNSDSAKADKFLETHLNYRQNRFVVLFQSEESFTNNPHLFELIKNAFSDLKHSPLKTEIVYPDANKQQISADKHTAYAVLMLKNNQELSDKALKEIITDIKKPPHLTMFIGGKPVFMSDTKQQTQRDLIRAEYIASPVAVITLLLVFGSVIAALVPMLLDGICAVFILTILHMLGKSLALSVFTLNIALLLGLCLSLDYALFIISRFREEMLLEKNIIEALAVTLATAGKAVFFSGLAVLISLSALLLFPINILFSVGVGGIIAVSVSVFVSVIILPALLAILKKKINLFSIRVFRKKDGTKERLFWRWLVDKVVHRPWTYFIFVLLLLLFMGLPFLSVQFGISDYGILPKDLKSRQVFDLFKEKFSENQLTPITVLATTKHGEMLTKSNIAYLYAAADKIRHDKRVKRVDSIVNTSPQLNKQQYQMIYTQGKSHLNSGLQQLLILTTKDNFTVLTVISKYPSDSEQTTALIKKLRNMNTPGLRIEVTGTPANTVDVLAKISNIFPYAFLWVIVLTYFILLFLLRSVFLPIKAILVNMLSLFASYGMLVFIIQEGHLAWLLNFEPQGVIDISLLIIIFCALFGFSMDYEVFLLSRIKERFEQTAHSTQSICYGIIHSSKIITSAAVIVILICFSFISANILLVKAFGLGIAIAIFIDAFLIRTLLVPAVMTILGRWNWYLPKWLDRILPKLSFNLKDKH